MTKILKAVLAATVAAFAVSSTASAGIFDFDPAEGGFYVSGFVGISAPSDADFEGEQNPAADVPGAVGAAANIEADFDSDVYFGGAVGAKLPFKYWKYFQPRLELEVSYSDNDVGEGSFNGGTQTFQGSQSTTFFLINNVSDIQWDENQKIIPYFGGGIGIADYNTNIEYFPATATAPTFAVRNSDSGFATVSTIGATFKATDRFDIYAEGRYLKTYGIDAERRFISGGADGFSAEVDDDPDGFTLAVGTRINF
ncbi:MAG: hypothetical protein ABJ275_01080 [Maricaulaceae bacterium]